jgi:hypothetical protein
MKDVSKIVFFFVFLVVILGWEVTGAYAIPPNNDFVDATALSGINRTITTNNVDATAETDEPNHGSGDLSAFVSIWFSWTAPSSGQIIFNTLGSDFDTVMAAYTGSSVDNLTKLAENDDAGLDWQSRIIFTAVAGTTYHIGVDGYDDTEQGIVVLNWQSPAPNNDFVDATALSGINGTITTNNVDATDETGEPNHGSGASSAFVSIWFSWTAPSSGQIMFNTFGSDFDTVMAAYTGSTVDNLTKLAEDDDAGLDLQSRIIFTAVAGTTYHIGVDGFDDTEQGIVVLNWQSPAPNNDFVDAVTLSGTNGTTTSNNVAATAETGEPNHGSGAPSAYSSMWFGWTAPSSGQILFNTFDSDFDTVMAAYTGSTVDNLTKLAANDDNGNDFQSRIAFSVLTGTTYYIAVDGYDDSEQGFITLNWEPGPAPPANDDFIDAISLTGAGGTANVHNFIATVETGEPDHGSGGSSVSSSIWFSWRAPSSAQFVFDTFGSDFDTSMAVYTGSSVANLTKLAENDDAGLGDQSQINFTAVAGSTYYIAIDGYQATQGYVVLNFPSAYNFPWAVFLPSIFNSLKP